MLCCCANTGDEDLAPAKSTGKSTGKGDKAPRQKGTPNLGDEFPDFKADTTTGEVSLHDWLGDSWGILFSHPADFTPVCTTELGRVVELIGDFQKRGVKLLALSCDPVADHLSWSKDVMAWVSKPGQELPFPIIADESRELATKFGMLDPDEKDNKGMPLSCRAVFIIGPDKRLKLSILYPATTGRNFSEILRVIDSLQLTAKHKVATPVDWKDGDDCIVVPSLTNDEANKMFPKGVNIKELPSGKQYLRYTPNPRL